MTREEQLKLEEQAAKAATKILDHIEFELDKDNPDLYKVKQLSEAYSSFKPYF